MLSHSSLFRVSADDIVQVFNQIFHPEYGTELKGGAAEPFYQVLPDGSTIIHFREDFTASALHEVAHWCRAGKKRRLLDDYGYWYEGARDALAQSRFEAVEVQPQALEWIFSMVLQISFRVSADNLQLIGYDSLPFRKNVRDAAEKFLSTGLPHRAEKFAVALNTLVAKQESWPKIRSRICVAEVPE